VQASCPQCGNRVAIDDAKVPEKPFLVKCPRCQAAIRLPGKGNATPAAAAAPVFEAPRAETMAPPHRELGAGSAPAGSRHALIALPDRGVAGAIGQALTRQGYEVDALDDPEEGARLLEQGVYDLVVTMRSAGKGEDLWQRCARLNPEARRRIFLVLVGESFRTADGTQAFAAVADLVINPKDAATAEAVLRTAVGERTRLYHVFFDARQRFEASAG
jgi:predicted Zn finger-like uncharacterized protein